MTVNFDEAIKKSRSDGYSDEEIFDYIKSTPKIAERYAASQQEGIDKKEVDTFVKEKLKLNTETPKTLLQNIYGALSYNPAAELLEYAIGRNPVSTGLKEVQRSLVTAGPAAIISAPHEIAHAPENIMNASEQFYKEHPEQVQSPDIVKGISDFALGGLDLAMESEALGADLKRVPGTSAKEITKNWPSFEDAIQMFRTEKEAPQTHLGKATERTVAGLATGGPVGAVIGASDYAAEIAGLSPERRAIMSLMIGKKQTGPKYVKPQVLAAEAIHNVNDLAAKMISHDGNSLNVPTLKAAYDLNMPIENIPLQALYKNGLPNLMEGISQNSFFGANKFNELLTNFTSEMTSRVNEVIESMPIDEGFQEISTKEHIGEPKFDNFLPQLFETAAPQLEIPKHETGKIGTNAIKAYDAEITDQYKALYDNVKFKPTDLLEPSTSEYEGLKKQVINVRKKLSSKGFKGAERVEALSVLKKIDDLFEVEEKPGLIILPGQDKPTSTIKKLPIKLEHIRKNIQDLNKTISYEHPTLVNLLEPVATNMRQILNNAAEEKPHLQSLVQANKLYAQKAQFFNDPIIKKLIKMTDENFYRAIRKNPSYLKRFSEFAEETGQSLALNDLKGQIMADVLERPLKASSPKELVSAITDQLIKETRELEPFYPELQGLSKSLQDTKKLAAQNLTPEGMFKSRIRQKILEDIMSDSDFTDTLKLMNTPKGIDLVRSTLSGTKQGKQLLKNLEHKKVQECLYNGPKKQEISFSDLALAFENPKTEAVLRKLLSEQNYKQAKDISKIAQQYEKGQKAHQGMKSKFEKGVGLGIIPALFMAPIQTTIGVSAMSYYLMSKNFKKSVIDNTAKNYESIMKPVNKKGNANSNKT